MAKPKATLRFPNKGQGFRTGFSGYAPEEIEVPEDMTGLSPAMKRFYLERPDLRSKAGRVRFIMKLMGHDQWVRGVTAIELAEAIGLKANTLEFASAEASRAIAILSDPETIESDFARRMMAQLDQAERIARREAKALSKTEDWKEKQAAAASYRAAAEIADRNIERLGQMSGKLPSKATITNQQVNVILDGKGNLRAEVLEMFDAFFEVLKPWPDAQKAIIAKFGPSDVKHMLESSTIEDAEIVETKP